ncbi:SusE domain-containing protein [Polaribacter sp. MSW13]|uniref:SusE domain-containing protein n=1 Tax=Polaribacter marinus TaxID=2916838 RepID=A0A9X2AJA5_9FLAO|nr:SusE domain-containing protein [Polaribacter marinus]MCI2228208.1 SusE domain-containing protein [Polaribacter marinus]
MKINLKKLSYLFLSLTLLLGSCEVEQSLTVTSPDPEFVLDTPGISSVFLNFALPNNPAFTITWKDEIATGADYTVEMSTDNEFTTPLSLGTTDRNSFSMSVDNFNNAITNAGVTSFRDVAIYMRIKSGDRLTNTILLLVTTYPVNAPTFSGVADGDAFVLSLDNNDAVAITVGWEDPILDSSLSIDVEYILEAAFPGTNFATPIEAGRVTNMNSITLTNAQLNAVAIQAGIPVDTAGDLELRIRSIITDSASSSVLERTSDSLTINVTTYLTVLDLSTTWGIVGSAANDWGATPDLPFFKTDVDGVLTAYVTLTDGEFKFRENNDWANNLGSDSSTGGALTSNGANMTVSAGSYKIVLDLNNMNYTIESFSLGIVGGAYNDWGATPDFMLEYDQYSDVFRGIVTLIDGEMKFRMNNDWGTNWGDNGADGRLELDGSNIVVTAGIYIATVDMNDLSYSLEPITNVWGLVGAAYNDWGATPDAQFKRDWSRPFDDIWILENVTLIDGEYKFRANNDWGLNYGDNDSDGVLEENGSNLLATAGTYTFILDFSDPANPTYTIN